VVGLRISPVVHLLLADLQDDVHSGARVVIVEGAHPDGEQVVYDCVGRDLQVVDVTAVHGTHEARRTADEEESVSIASEPVVRETRAEFSRGSSKGCWATRT
jgi:hypothetical protein